MVRCRRVRSSIQEVMREVYNYVDKEFAQV